MTFPDNTFDVVWACESGEHMPDKKLYVEEMTRVLKPGGRIVIATWCQRDDSKKPFDADERKMLDFLYAEVRPLHITSILSNVTYYPITFFYHSGHIHILFLSKSTRDS